MNYTIYIVYFVYTIIVRTMGLRSVIARTRAASGRWWATLGLGLVVALHLVGGLPFQDALRMLSFDLYESALPKPAPARSVLIVGIDEASLERYGQWPWPRTLLARLLDRIAAARPTAVGIHFLLPEPDQFSACEVTRYVPSIDPALVRRVCALPSNDAVLAASLRRARSVLGTIGEEGASRGQTPTALALAPAPVQVTGEDPRARLRH